MTRISFDDVRETLAGVLRKLGFSLDRAQKCARLFAETTCDGVYTHGINRFPRMVAMVRNGSIDVAADPRRVAGFGALERWGRTQRTGKSQRANVHGAGLGAEPRARRGISDAGQHQPTGCVAARMAGRLPRAGTDRNLLDEYATLTCLPGAA